MDADVLGDLVGRSRRSDRRAVDPAGSRPYTAHKFCTDAWKAGNLFRYHGAGRGRGVAIADDRAVEVLVALFGAALLGAPVRVAAPDDGIDARLVVAPAGTVGAYDPPAGATRIAYGGVPADPTVVHFERDLWSENPTEPPDEVAPGDPALATDGEAASHRALLGAAGSVLDRLGLEGNDRVVLRASLTHPGSVVAGVLAPLAAGATVVLPGERTEAAGTVAVADGDAPEERVLSPVETHQWE